MWRKIKNIYHFNQAIVANTVYLFPSRGMTIIGVTGTDGKTTTSSLIYHILISGGYKAALISSIGAKINGRESDLGFHVTTPGRFAIQSYLKQARKEGVKYVVLEVTSHALDQYRVAGIHFDVGVLTNVTKEHLDYHKTYEKYVATKAKLLKQSAIAVVNKDDHSYMQLRKVELRGKENIITYGMKKDADFNPHVFPFHTKLIGQFNKYNCLAAISALQPLHFPSEVIRKGIASFRSPKGRQEIIYRKDFIVMNDFAHTPNSFSAILSEMRKMTTNRLIHIFGSAAKRDTYKRPVMGRISSKYADIMIVTAEDPRNEAISDINNDILSGVTDGQFSIVTDVQKERIEFEKGKKYIFIIPDRREAISFGIQIAKKGDVVVMTGKGHEKSMNYGKGEEPWNETEIAKNALRERRLL